MTLARDDGGRGRESSQRSMGGASGTNRGADLPGGAPKPLRSTGDTVRRRVHGPTRFQYPVGIEMIEGENYRQREGYDVIYLKDDDCPRYQYTVAASAERTAEVFRALLGLLPEEVCAVLEVPGPGPEGDGRDVCEVWMSPSVERNALLGAFDSHERLFVHDGMVGVGAVSPDGATEIFLDEHKLIYFYAPGMDGAEEALTRFGLSARSVLRHFSELGHVHVSLSSRGAGDPYWKVADEIKRTLGLELEETKEYI